MRSANRTLSAAGALAGGASASLLGVVPTLLFVIVIFAAAFGVALGSPVRTARDDETS